MPLVRFIQKWGLVITSFVLLALSGLQVAHAHGWAVSQWAPTKGRVYGYANLSFPGKRSIDSWVRWETTYGCVTNSPLYMWCSKGHRVYEHNVEMSNYRSVYPEEYRWGKYPEAWNGNFPGTAYLDTQASDDSSIESWTVGTLDGTLFKANTTYYANVLGSADYPGPNWFQLRHEYGVIDSPGCMVTVSAPWCMLYPHGGHTRIPMNWRNTLPGDRPWYGQ